jgi:hypothetical protein
VFRGRLYQPVVLQPAVQAGSKNVAGAVSKVEAQRYAVIFACFSTKGMEI